jgi:hypothetical protein
MARTGCQYRLHRMATALRLTDDGNGMSGAPAGSTGEAVD